MAAMKRAALVALALGVAGSLHAQSVQIEVGLGQTGYRIQTDGIWYQLGQPHQLATHGKAYMLGLSGDAWRSDHAGIAWHADYVDLGRLDAWCECTTDENYDYLAHRSREANVPGGTFVGTGRARGVQIALEPYINVGAFRIGYQWGYTLFQPLWDESIYGWQSPDGQSLDFTRHTLRAWRPGRVSGVSVSTGQVSLVYAHYTLPTHYPMPALFTGADTLMFVWRFKP